MKEHIEKYDKQVQQRRKFVVLEELRNLKGDNSDLANLYTKKEIVSIKKAELKEVKDSLDKKLKEQVENEKKYFNEQIKLINKNHKETMKRLSRLNKEEKSLSMSKLENRWDKQFTNLLTRKRCPKGTRKNKVGACEKK